MSIIVENKGDSRVLKWLPKPCSLQSKQRKRQSWDAPQKVLSDTHCRVGKQLLVRQDRWQDREMLLYHEKTHYALGYVPELGARLAASKPTYPIASIHHSVGFMGTWEPMSGFLCCCWGFKLRSSNLQSKCSYSLSPTPQFHSLLFCSVAFVTN